MQKKTMIYAGATALGALLLLAWAFAPRPLEVEVARVTEGPMEVTVNEDGKTRLRDRYVVSAPLAGLVNRITLREGDTVAANALLATIRPTLAPLQDARTQAALRARIAVTEALVRRNAARIESARVAMERAQRELERSQQLAKQGFIAPSRLDNDRLAVASAQREVDAAASDGQAARHEVEQARAALQTVLQPAQDGRQDFEVRAPINATVLKVVQNSEAVVSLGTSLLELGDVQALEIVAELLTADALQARPGSRVKIERWGGAPLEGRVRRIEPAAFTKISALGVEEQRVNVLIDFVSPPAQWQLLGDGFRVEVGIVTLARERVVKLPVSALFPLPQSADSAAAGAGMAVYVLENEHAHLRPVEIGARNDRQAWVTRGVAPGAVVIVYPAPEVRDGARVKPRTVQATP